MKLITDILREYRRGQLVDEASEQFQDVVKAVLATGKPSELSIVLKVTPNKGDTSLVIVAGQVKAKVAKEELPSAIFYADDSGDLHRSDPKQRDLLVEAVGGEERRASAQ